MMKSSLKQANKQSIKGFTLVELSIVIVIIGLLVGGLIAGQAIIDGGKVRAVISEMSDFQGAYTIFKEKYNSLPGDYNRATGAGRPFQGASPTIYNGNGDGQILWSDAGLYNEGAQAWMMFAKEGLVGGSFSDTGGNVFAVPGTNVPISKLSDQAGYAFHYYNTAPHLIRNHLLLGAKQSTTGINHVPILTALMARSIDKKFDDGLPAQGVIRGDSTPYTAGTNTCINGSAYDMDNTTGDDLLCALMIQLK
jgi:prepilin-type N-terminal cleavage/methylation domain-containing protein